MTTDELDLLVNTRHLPALRSLEPGRDFSLEQTVLLLQSPLVLRLIRLSLVNNQLGDGLARQLESADRLRLTGLNLHGNDIGAGARESLAEAPQFTDTVIRYRCGARGCRWC
ncbi:hypothetical protein [Krasilnikovia sp. MM14-A1259]|uniref:hypothetical protein n=1 Tax=Krasilnikovia sp. MM14-A1259 TaxID=3373539 RepID=UPI0037F7EDCE